MATYGCAKYLFSPERKLDDPEYLVAVQAFVADVAAVLKKRVRRHKDRTEVSLDTTGQHPRVIVFTKHRYLELQHSALSGCHAYSDTIDPEYVIRVELLLAALGCVPGFELYLPRQWLRVEVTDFSRSPTLPPMLTTATKWLEEDFQLQTGIRYGDAVDNLIDVIPRILNPKYDPTKPADIAGILNLG